ncbi:hypothetical protein IPM65_07205 [Candidatus Roizmanbacteria bacterium]|nr:MAG: hypothetical protein IPM65_07205 [Candidatus Roizmanbacteria bacterium]
MKRFVLIAVIVMALVVDISGILDLANGRSVDYFNTVFTLVLSLFVIGFAVYLLRKKDSTKKIIR